MQAILGIRFAPARSHRVMLREWSGVNFAIVPLQGCTNLYQPESDSAECWTVQPQHKNGVVAVV